MFPLQPQAHAVKGQHPVDGKMGANVPQKINIPQPPQPIGVIHHRFGGQGRHQTVNHPHDPRFVVLDGGIIQHLAGGVFAGWIPHLCGAPAEQNHGLMAGVVKMPQQHQGQQTAHMQTIRRTIKPDIGPLARGQQPLIQFIQPRPILQQTAGGKGFQKI